MGGDFCEVEFSGNQEENSAHRFKAPLSASIVRCSVRQVRRAPARRVFPATSRQHQPLSGPCCRSADTMLPPASGLGSRWRAIGESGARPDRGAWGSGGRDFLLGNLIVHTISQFKQMYMIIKVGASAALADCDVVTFTVWRRY